MRRATPLAVSLATLLFAVPVFAADRHADVAFSPARFAEQRSAVLRSLNTKTYAAISDKDRAAVKDALDRMAAKLDGVERLDQLEKRDRITVFNDQELINTLLTAAAEDSRLICKRERTVGTNRAVNVCLTVAERRELQRVAQNQMRAFQGSLLPVPDVP